MADYNLKDLEGKYDLEMEKIIKEVRDTGSKLVLLQFPDGLKPYATCVVDFLKSKTKAEFLIWFGSCYGVCDMPIGLQKLSPKIDLAIQFGHNQMKASY
jgi:2-(3-amino-3-carboxypropyl)histidine synthase